MHNVSRIRSILFALVVLVMSATAFAQISISVNFAPPELPVYEQPLCPAPGYLWTPGYWAYGDDYDDYYWVPGTWVMAPEIGSCGLQPIGVGAETDLFSMTATGVRA